MLLLDFIRYHQHLTGTKIGCREGDCGACTILIGELKNGELGYSSATSCLVPIGNVHGKHVVSIEGINLDQLNYIQQSFAQEGATQCGFCTPGFIMSLAGYSLDKDAPVKKSPVDAVNGNICRCTGYKSIEKAAGRIAQKLEERKGKDPIRFAVEHKFLPGYFLEVGNWLKELSSGGSINPVSANKRFAGGGTDLYVQQHDSMVHADIEFLFNRPEMKGITREGNRCIMGGSVTVTDIAESPVFKEAFKELPRFIKLVSSTQIRNMATIAGNFTNASPIGDMTIFFLALDAQLVLVNGDQRRKLPLRNFYKGYKQLAKESGEYIEQVWFELPGETSSFNFEKVCKRTHLDIASVNAAICISTENGIVKSAGLSAGGVGPVPAFLSKASAFLTGKKINTTVIEELIAVAQSEISPISDVRGTIAYKRLLLSQLIRAHFAELFTISS